MASLLEQLLMNENFGGNLSDTSDQFATGMDMLSERFRDDGAIGAGRDILSGFGSLLGEGIPQVASAVGDAMPSPTDSMEDAIRDLMGATPAGQAIGPQLQGQTQEFLLDFLTGGNGRQAREARRNPAAAPAPQPATQVPQEPSIDEKMALLAEMMSGARSTETGFSGAGEAKRIADAGGVIKVRNEGGIKLPNGQVVSGTDTVSEGERPQPGMGSFSTYSDNTMSREQRLQQALDAKSKQDVMKEVLLEAVKSGNTQGLETAFKTLDRIYPGQGGESVQAGLQAEGQRLAGEKTKQLQQEDAEGWDSGDALLLALLGGGGLLASRGKMGKAVLSKSGAALSKLFGKGAGAADDVVTKAQSIGLPTTDIVTKGQTFAQGEPSVEALIKSLLGVGR